MRILFLTPQPPWPLHQGPAIRNHQLIAGAATRHQVYVLCFSEQPPDLTPLEQVCAWVGWVPAPRRTVRQRLWQLLRSHLPDLAWRLESLAFRDRLRFILQNQHIDVVQCEGLEMAPYIPLVQEVSPTSRIVLDEHNVEYLLQRRMAEWSVGPGGWYSAEQARRLKDYEAWALAQSDGWVAVSQEDATLLDELVPGRPHAVIPIGVDPAVSRTSSGRLSPFPRLFFAGKLDYRPNADALRWFCTQVWPLIKEAVPSVEFVIAGRGAPPRAAWLRQKDIRLVGYLDDAAYTETLQSAWVCPIPLRIGSGMRVKVLEAFAWAKPVVTTSVGIEGIQSLPGVHARVADAPETFAAHVVELLRDRLLAEEQGLAARRLAEELYDWHRFTPLLLDFYERVTGHGDNWPQGIAHPYRKK